ncbi:MAG: hypothetical protein AAF050_07755 [Cyanobacteria bacterium J06649_5]
MRKVTASAVILTALTGCNQGGIPSTQWSFEVPFGDNTDGAQADAVGSDRVTNNELSATSTVIKPVGSNAPDSAFEKAMMGPAFEQPTVEATLSKPLASTRNLLGTASGSPSDILGVAPSSPALKSIASSRPDPIDQVRSYLRSSGSPTALANRAPYASQVYLSSVPTAPLDPTEFSFSSSSQFPVSAPIISAPISGIGNSTSSRGVTSSVGGLAPLPSTTDLMVTSANAKLPEAPSAFTANTQTQPQVALNVQTSTQANVGSAEDRAVYGDIAYVDGGSQQESTATLSNTAFDTEAEAYIMDTVSTVEGSTAEVFEDGLPQLTPAPAEDFASLPAVSATTIASQVPQPDAEESIGTSILRDLQRTSRQEVAASLLNQDTPNAIEEVTEEVSEEISLSPTTPFIAASASEHRPTLERLIRTMPHRELSPLLAHRRSEISAQPQSSLIEFPAQSSELGMGVTPSEHRFIDNDPIESRTIESHTHSGAADIFESDTAVNLQSNNSVQSPLQLLSQSPLLEGLRETEARPTLYVPIAETSANDVSGDLVRKALAALSQKHTEATSAADSNSSFDSVLTSAASVSSTATATGQAVDPSASQANKLLDNAVQAADIKIEILPETISPLNEELTSPFNKSSLRENAAIKAMLNTSNADSNAFLLNSIQKGSRRQVINWQ